MKVIKALTIIFAGLAGAFAITFFVSYLGLTAGFRTLIVLSGSMEPALKVGSLAVVIPQENYFNDEIISFSPTGNQKDIVTHRIVSRKYEENILWPPAYQTAGDANQAPDPNLVKHDQILGRMIFSLPYAGYLANFMKEPAGFILLVIVPITIVVYEEIRGLKREFQKLLKKIWQSRTEINHLPRGPGFNLLALILPLVGVGLSLASVSAAYFADQEKSPANSFVAGAWVTPTPTLPPVTPPPLPVLTKIVINEVYYDVAADKGADGGGADSDEWVELYNNTVAPINLQGWSIADNTSAVSVSSATYIPAYGFALLAKSANTWTKWTIPATAEKISLGGTLGNGLANGGDNLILKNDQNEIVDQMSWESDISGFTSGCGAACPGVAEGHSLERDPDGKDTDAAEDFIDQSNPSPGS